MKIYKYLDINKQEYISKKLYEYVEKFTPILRRKWFWNTVNKTHLLKTIPELDEELKTIIDHEITMISIIYRPPNYQGGIHIDNITYPYRVLYPIKNCKGSYTKFYNLNGNDVIEKFGDQGDRHLVPDTTYPLLELESVELTNPIVFNTQIPHGVYTNPEFTEPRLSATFGFGDFPLESLLRD
jgi:hypothetical protein